MPAPKIKVQWSHIGNSKHSTNYIMINKWIEIQRHPCHQELMNRHSEKEQLTNVPILCRITLQNGPYKDYKLLVLTSFEVTTVTSMDSQEPRLL